jgi:hypothetical protein
VQLGQACTFLRHEQGDRLEFWHTRASDAHGLKLDSLLRVFHHLVRTVPMGFLAKAVRPNLLKIFAGQNHAVATRGA